VAADCTCSSDTAATDSSVDGVLLDGKALLFTTKTCPNCKMARSIMDAGHFEYDPIDAEENADLCHKFDVHQAPTLVVIKSGSVEKFSNVSDIKKYVRG
jgi:ribonucleoside-triphosphate reductase